jgi:hypothetical protein
LGVDVAERLVHAHRVGNVGKTRFRDAIESLDALGRDDLVAYAGGTWKGLS